jgi:hypothetical protein
LLKPYGNGRGSLQNIYDFAMPGIALQIEVQDCRRGGTALENGNSPILIRVDSVW